MSAGEGVVSVTQADMDLAGIALGIRGEPGCWSAAHRRRSQERAAARIARHRLSTANQGAGEWRVPSRDEIAAIIKPAAYSPTFVARKANVWGSEKDAHDFQNLLRDEALQKADAILALLPASPTPPVRGGE